ncbi:MAG: hypothetical protein L6V93_17650 [Clostridiales bacterium]|nr:MAG: hypothetical protein L6V93_17650 [Clostridiales bacterium]
MKNAVLAVVFEKDGKLTHIAKKRRLILTKRAETAHSLTLQFPTGASLTRRTFIFGIWRRARL